MKVFVFDLVHYDRNLDYLKATGELSYPLEKRYFEPEVAVKTYAEHLEAWAEMDRLGFDGVAINEHHTTPYGMMNSPNLLAAAAAQRTKRLKILIYGNLLPLHNPLRLAEEIAMLDCLSDGRIICGVARGAPREYKVYNIPMGESRARFEECYEIMQKAWTEERFSYHGRFHTFDDLSIWPRPVQQPAPPVWAPISGSKESIEWAAARDIPITPFPPGEAREDIVRHYARHRAAAGLKTTPEHISLLVDAYVADDKAAAIREYGPHVRYFFNTLFNFDHILPKDVGTGYTSTKAHEHLRPELRKAAEADAYRPLEMTEDAVAKIAETAAWGDPDEVAERIIAEAEHAGAGTVLISMNRGSMPQQMYLNQIRRFAAEVLPKLHAHKVDRVKLAEDANEPVGS